MKRRTTVCRRAVQLAFFAAIFWTATLSIPAASRQVFAADPSGAIIGVIAQAPMIKAVVAIDRNSGKRLTGKFDAASGQFTLEGLPLDAAYDILIDFEEARLEGVDLSVPRSDYEEEQPLSAEDAKTIREKILALNKFEDVVEILDIRGNIQHAAILMNKLRTRPFYGSKPGEVVWRAEVWRFERPEETWVKTQDELFLVLYRERIPKGQYDRKCIHFDPRLGGLRLTSEMPRINLGDISLPSPKPGVRLRGKAAMLERPEEPSQ